MPGKPEHRILVIDDEQVVLDASARLLFAEGFDVVTALDAESGLDLAKTAAPDLALVDLKLPRLSGLDFMDAVLEHDPSLHVILATGVSTADQAVAALNHGAFDFLPKPFTYEELMSPVLRAYRHQELLEQGAALRLPPADPSLLFLGLQAWAHPQEHSLIRLGASDLFQRTAGSVLEIVLPRVNAEIRQGAPLARVRTADGRWHVVLAAAGGRVVEANAQLADAPQLLNNDPFGEGWIAELQCPEFHRELPNLRSQ